MPSYCKLLPVPGDLQQHKSLDVLTQSGSMGLSESSHSPTRSSHPNSNNTNFYYVRRAPSSHFQRGTTSSHPRRSKSARPSSAYSATRSYSYNGNRARPRGGYIQRIVDQIKRLVRDLYRYARRHPVKVFFLLVMPLITGGVLHDLARHFGFRLPAIFAPAALRGFDDLYYGGRRAWRGAGDYGDGDGGAFGGLMRIAKAYM